LTPEEAFYHIEFPVESRKNIIVEDVLAKDIVSSVLEKMGEETKNLFHVKFNPGGESVIKKEFITVFCREINAKDYVLFDGDQIPANSHYDWREFSVSDLTIDYLKTKIREQTGEDIKFSVDGGQRGGNRNQQLALLKTYLDYYMRNVSYLPKRIPEDIIWNDELATNQIIALIPDTTQQSKALNELACIVDSKKKFAFIASILQGSSNSESIASVHKQFTQRWLNEENDDFDSIKSVIQSIIAHD
jgi:hypothetical protein